MLFSLDFDGNFDRETYYKNSLRREGKPESQIWDPASTTGTFKSR